MEKSVRAKKKKPAKKSTRGKTYKEEKGKGAAATATKAESLKRDAKKSAEKKSKKTDTASAKNSSEKIASSFEVLKCRMMTLLSNSKNLSKIINSLKKTEEMALSSL